VTVSARPTQRPRQVMLSVSLTCGRSHLSRNAWPLWQLPRLLGQRQPGDKRDAPDASEVAVETRLTNAILDEVDLGRCALIWLCSPDCTPSRVQGRAPGVEPEYEFVQPMPFWREAIHVFTPPFRRLSGLGPLPHADMRFYGVATDMTIDVIHLQEWLARWRPATQPHIQPLWRRFDARRMVWHDYVLDVYIGRGVARLVTLRLAGGLGDQPDTLATNPMGAWLLRCLSRF